MTPLPSIREPTIHPPPSDPVPPHRFTRLTARRVAIGYALFGVAWVGGTDLLIERLGLSPAALADVQLAKGWIFVLISAAAVYLAMRAEVRGERASAGQSARAALADNLPGLVYRCRNDPQWTMELVSRGARELTGHPPEDLLANRRIAFADLIHPDDRGRVWDQVQAALADRRAYRFTYRLRTASGEERWVLEQGQGIWRPDGELEALEGLITDFTEQQAVQDRLLQQIARLDALHDIDRAIAASHDLPLALATILDHAVAQLGVDAADVLLLDRPSGVLRVADSRGLHRRRRHLRVGEGLAGTAAADGRLVSVPDLADVADREPAPEALAAGFTAYVAAPLVTSRGVLGILELYRRAPLPRDPAWESYLRSLAGRAAVAADAAQLFEELRRSNVELALAYEQTIEGWSRALDLRDRETEGHTQRVTELTVRLARRMGVGGDELTHLRRGALLHDIGKMGVPDRILLKPDRLTEDEWQLMRRHPTYAYQLLSPIRHLRHAVDIPYCHHERWDGTGYPRGLAGEEIPLPARIFAVVDVWDALTSDRPYRPAWSREQALQHIRDGAGSHFDPRAVAEFAALEAEGGLSRAAPASRTAVDGE